MKDKLRELAERWKGPECRNGSSHECADELLSILDAEGDGGAVGYVAPDNKIIFYVSDGWSREVPPGTDLFAHPARSGVVSDEDVIEACEHYDVNYEEGSRAEFIGMRAALEHFAKGERHER